MKVSKSYSDPIERLSIFQSAIAVMGVQQTAGDNWNRDVVEENCPCVSRAQVVIDHYILDMYIGCAEQKC